MAQVLNLTGLLVPVSMAYSTVLLIYYCLQSYIQNVKTLKSYKFNENPSLQNVAQVLNLTYQLVPVSMTYTSVPLRS